MRTHVLALVGCVALLGTPRESMAQVGRTAGNDPASAEALPAIPGLPDLFMMSNGRKVSSADDWQKRRAEMKDLLQRYQYGRLPPRPDIVTAEVTKRKPHKSGKGTEEWVTLTIGSKRKLPMRILLYLPDSAGPHPVVIREEGTLGRTKQVPMFMDKGYVFVEYARHELDPDRRGVVGPAQKAYPEYDWATLAVWAWGAMRVVDYLETRDDVDLGRIAVTGHSRGGKAALLAGALDERFALVVPNGSGAGGAGCYRVLGPGAESLAMNDKPHWYLENLRRFGGHEERLPLDQHFLKALVAPRALLCTESMDDAFANPLGTQVTSMAAAKAYEFLGADERKNGLHFRRGGHDSNTEDWRALLTFAEWHFFGRAPEDPDRFWQTPWPVPNDFLPKHAQTSAAREPPKPGTTGIAGSAPAGTFMKSVAVGSPNNAADQDYFGCGAFGSVAYEFEIAKRQVTNKQYAAFLNAVAANDPHGLFNEQMARDPRGGIIRLGSAGRWRYEAKASMRDQPAGFVSWYDALRFCNWMHNGMPSGSQDAETTEDGAYTLRGPGQAGPRRPNAKAFLPTEDEWYKAAYFASTAAAGDAYRLFSKNRGQLSVVEHPRDSVSAIGMQGIGDGVWEWNEAVVGSLFRGLRSGTWFVGNNRQAAGHFYSNPMIELADVGFRVARPAAGDQ